MNVRRVDRLLHIRAVIDHVADNLQHRVSDGVIRLLRRSRSRDCRPVAGRTWESLMRAGRSGRDRVPLALDRAITIRARLVCSRSRHLVVEQHAGAFRDNAGTKPEVQSVGVRNRVSAASTIVKCVVCVDS
jgi:hypothetical protein